MEVSADSKDSLKRDYNMCLPSLMNRNNPLIGNGKLLKLGGHAAKCVGQGETRGARPCPSNPSKPSNPVPS